MKKAELSDKLYLNPGETIAYFNLSARKFYKLIEQPQPFVALYGTRKLIIKSEFIKYFGNPKVKEMLIRGEPKTKKRC